MRMLTHSFVLAVLLLVLAATPALAGEITLTDEGFEPDTLEVSEGTTVVWRNATDSVQIVVAEDSSWDSGPVEAGESFSLRMRSEGEVAFATEDGTFEGRVLVAAEAPEAEDEDDEEPTLPLTGIDPVGLVGLALVLVGTGSLLVRVGDRASKVRPPHVSA